MQSAEHRPTAQGRIDALAYHVAQWATCPRASVGAVIHRDEHVLSTGRNGAPPGVAHCTEAGCIIEYSERVVVPPEIPDGPPEEHCRRANHAEMNALAIAAANGTAVRGASLTITHTPCRICRGALAVAGIVDIRVLNEYRKWS